MIPGMYDGLLSGFEGGLATCNYFGFKIALFIIDHNQLFYLAYERVKVSVENMQPHLWSYRQRISLEHLGQTLKLKDKYPILHEFLQKVCPKIIVRVEVFFI